jgi:glycosyltransferase involved in cell wall biosynthesis
MKIAVYTLTRDRLEYTKHCFGALRSMAGHSFDHFVVDNGSEDGTSTWLQENADQFKGILLNDKNYGISEGSNEALGMIYVEEMKNHCRYDLIIKMDNDCEVVTPNILAIIASIYESLENSEKKYILSPRVYGINNQPARGGNEIINGHKIGLTAIVGGLFHIVPREVYGLYQYPLNTPKARGQDDDFCAWAKRMEYEVGYIEDIAVNHFETTNGQAQRFPDYFKRKWEEEKL